jgi:hypothetical protein
LDEQNARLEDFPELVSIKQSFSDFAKKGCSGVYTCSMVFRNLPSFRKAFNEDWILELDGADHLLLLLATLNGESIYILPEYMGVYRRHLQGAWTSSSSIKRARGGLDNNELYKLHLPLSRHQRQLIDWNNINHFTQIIYSQQRKLPKPINRVFNKVLSVLPRLFGLRGYSTFLNPIYHKVYSDFLNQRPIN